MFRTTVFILLSVFSLSAKAQYPDIILLKKIHHPEPKRADSFWKVTSATVLPASIALPVSSLSLGYAMNNRELKTLGWHSAGTILLNELFTSTMKYSFKRDRPYKTYPEIFPKSKTGNFSFPSGHASAAFATATSLSFAYPKWYVIGPSYLWAGAVAFSRMKLGVHFPGDIFGGIIIGIGSAFIMNQILLK